MTETHYIVDVLVLLTAAVVDVPVFQRLGLGSVLGYLAAGAVVGPGFSTPLLLFVTPGTGVLIRLYIFSQCGEVIWINKGGGRQ